MLKEEYPRLWNTWRAMNERCNNKNNKAYKYYGGKGIKVCDDWRTFKQFLNWSLNSNYIDGYTIDRLDTSKDYEPDNCTWVSHKENVTRANKSRRGTKFKCYSKNQILSVISLLETTDKTYVEISKETEVSLNTITDINNCHTHTKFHNYKSNIRGESVQTIRDECSEVE